MVSARSSLEAENSEPVAQASRSSHQDNEDEDAVEETDESGRYTRYHQAVGSGRFKTVYKGFDERQGIDVAWSKIDGARNNLTADQLLKVQEEISVGEDLNHPNVIKTFACWYDERAHCINMITEFFTGGNLREYRQKSRQLGMQAVKKWGRQVLQGLAYLHNREPPVVHGDLRPDKIYIHGHSGEIKIGDLGLAVLVPKRFAPGVMPEGDPSNQYTRSVDLFAFGLVMLELVTNKRLNTKDDGRGPSGNTSNWEEVLADVQDEAARTFIARCLAPAGERPSALEALEDPFLRPEQPKPPPAAQDSKDLAKSKSDVALVQAEEPGSRFEQTGSDEDNEGVCEAGFVRGEDYEFRFTGRVREGKHHFRLHMEYVGEEAEEEEGRDRTSKTIDFVYDPDVDTADEIAAEIGSEFELTPADRDNCAAALKEWLDRMGQRSPDPDQR